MRDAVETVRREAEEKVALLKATSEMSDVLRLHRSLNSLQEYLKEPKTTLAELFGLDTEAGEARSAKAPPTVRFDEFFGMQALDAAKAYLRKQPDARLFDEIVEAIKNGGGKVESVEKLRSGLSRSTLDVVKIGDRYGWLEKYPDEKARRHGKWTIRKATDDAKEDPKKDEASTSESTETTKAAPGEGVAAS